MPIRVFLLGVFALTCLGFHSFIERINQSASLWYEETKREILKQSALKADSTALYVKSDSTKKRETYFSRGQKFLVKFYRNGILSSEYYFSKDGNFDLRREFCDNGDVNFEGIGYKTSLYGPFTRWHCNGKVQEQGYHFRSEKIGSWKTFDGTGKLIYVTDHKFHALLDSLPQITR